MTTLLDAIDALTKPIIDRQPEGSIREGEQIRRACLLAQLRSAITSDLTAGGGKSLPSQRIPLDPTALAIYTRIETAITAAFRDIGGNVPGLHPEDVLRAWYVQFMQSNPRDVTVDDWTARIAGWVGEIERMLNPPKKRELVDTPCIICGKADAIDESGNLVTAVIVEYRHDEHEGMRIEQTLCRACKQTWDGEHGASSFRRYADEQESAAVPYEVEIANGRARFEDALEQAVSAFRESGTVYGRVRLKHSPTTDDPVWRFAAHLHDTPVESAA